MNLRDLCDELYGLVEGKDFYEAKLKLRLISNAIDQAERSNRNVVTFDEVIEYKYSLIAPPNWCLNIASQEGMADEFNMTKSTFMRRMSATRFESYRGFVVECRKKCIEALFLLGEPLKEVGFCIGFKDEASICRFIRTHYEATPCELRAEITKSQ